MLRVNRCVALVFIVTANVGVSKAENHPKAFGQYSTAVNETRLFVNDNTLTTLRCDLFFSATGSDQTIVAPKGSVVMQTVPAFVWQYSGLLPVTDYLKTVAIHSTSTDSKENSWQNVQLDFYNGLRVEGVRESGAKIAYAGAYAFSPRWPLVELIDIPDPRQVQNTKLYKVKYTPVIAKGVSVSEYQTLAQDILSAPQRVSLQDIRGVIDAADAAKAMNADRIVGSSINDLFAGNQEPKKTDQMSETVQQPVVDSEPVVEKGKEIPIGGTTMDDLFSDEVILSDVAEPAMEKMPVESVEVIVPQMDEQLETQAQPALEIEVEEETDKAILGPEDPMIVDVIVKVDPEVEDQSTPVTADTSLGIQPNVWKTMPDGSVVLVQIEG